MKCHDLPPTVFDSPCAAARVDEALLREFAGMQALGAALHRGARCELSAWSFESLGLWCGRFCLGAEKAADSLAICPHVTSPGPG